MLVTKKEYQRFNRNNYDSFILVGDIGGTNTNLGIFGIKGKLQELLLLFSFDTKKLKGLHGAVNETLNQIQQAYKVRITNACFAAAGVLSAKKDYVATQNLPWDINKKELLAKTKLEKIFLINDFEAIGYSINILKDNDLIVIKKARKVPKASVVVIGAGTGLGKTMLIYKENYKLYAPLPSEAGHSDFSAQNQEELNLINFIKKSKKIKQSIPYELVLSGQGLTNIYLFLRKSHKFKETKYTKEIEKSKYLPELISKCRKKDKTCKETFQIFKKIYARFARNMAIDSLAFGGVYIAGGIAPKNRDIFDKEFVKMFEDNYKLKYVLRKIPIYLIVNQNVGLLGAGFLASRVLR